MFGDNKAITFNYYIRAVVPSMKAIEYFQAALFCGNAEFTLEKYPAIVGQYVIGLCGFPSFGR